MTAVSKFIASITVIGSIIALSFLFVENESFRVFYWKLVGQNVMYASLGAITMFASIIAVGSLLWNRN
jgi:hypothetical protein